MRLLAVSDEIEEQLLDERTAVSKGHVDLVVGCGDLPADYLDALSCRYSAPLLFVRGNHDPPRGQGGYPLGAEIDGRVVREGELLFAGLEGSVRYSDGPHQYSEWQMRNKVIGLRLRLRRRRLDVLITHGPPSGVHEGDDRAHQGLAAVRQAVDWMRPQVLLHGHVHTYGNPISDAEIEETRIINVVGHRLIEVARR